MTLSIRRWSTEEALWIICSSATASDEVLREVSRSCDSAPFRVRPESILLRTQRDDSPEPSPVAWRTAQPCGAIIVVEREVLHDPVFRDWVGRCIQLVRQREDFRLFLCLKGMSPATFRSKCAQDEMLATLLDTVHLAPDLSVDHLYCSLRGFLEQRAALRDELTWRRLRLTFAMIAGGVAALAQAIATALTLFAGAALLVAGRSSAVSWFPGSEVALSTIAALLIFPAATILAFQMSRPTLPDTEFAKRLGWFGSAVLVLVCVFRLALGAGMPWGWLLLGGVTGGLLDGARRQAIHAYLTRRPLDPRYLTPEPHRLTLYPAEPGGQWLPDALTTPFLPFHFPVVFISYAHSSSWGCETAQTLYQALRKEGVECFLDRELMRHGSNWRRRLEYGISAATVVISLADPSSVRRAWTTAELEAALTRKRWTGLPDVVILLSPDLTTDAPRSPVFDVILREEGRPPREEQPRLIRYRDTTVRLVAQQLRPRVYSNPSILPAFLIDLLSGVTGRILCAITVLAMPALLSGLLCVLLATTGTFTTAANWLSDWAGPWAVGLLGGGWAGYLSRMVFSARFEVPTKWARSIAVLAAVAALGISRLAAHSLTILPSLGQAWVVVTAILGWALFGSFDFRFSLDKPEFRRLRE